MSDSHDKPILLERLLDPVQAFALFHFLDAHGIPVTLRERPLRTALGEIPFLEAPAELFLDDPTVEAKARELIERFRSGPTGIRGAVWRCPQCGETHEPEFGACWNCGTPRP